MPVGTEFDVRLQTTLSSRTAKVEQRFEATTVLDLTLGRDVAVPSGSVVRGFVSSVRPAGRIDRTGSLTLSFDEVAVGPQISRIRASVVKAIDPKVTDDAARIGAGAVVGAVIGAMVLGVGLTFILNYLGTSLNFISGFVVLILVLLIKPDGLIAARKGRRA